METEKSNGKGPFRGVFGKEVARVEIGRYVRLLDLSGETPEVIFELRDQHGNADPHAGPVADDHAGAVIDFFERLVRREVPDEN